MSTTNESVLEVVRSRRLNAVLAWVLVGLVGFVALGAVVTRNFLWVGFALIVAGLVVVPPLAYRNPRVMLPWEVVALAALPLLGRLFATVEFTGNIATYLSVAAIALIIAVELSAFTPVDMSVGFAVLFVVVATMAAAGMWAVVRWLADIYLGTGFLGTEEALMWEFVGSTVAGIGAGVVFEYYFRRRVRAKDRVPRGVEIPDDEEVAGA
jgi:hypothetical protein